jgi:hypothetical protein
MIFWSLRVFIWFKNMKKMQLQMTSGFLQLESTIPIALLQDGLYFKIETALIATTFIFTF